MDKNKNKESFKNAFSVKGMLVIFIAICILTIVFCFQYYSKLHTTIRDESKGYLQEVSRRIGSNMDRIINDNYAVLNTMASMVETINSTSFYDVKALLQKQKAFWSYETILLIDQSGKAYDLDNKEVFLNIDSSIRNDLLSQKRTMSTAQIINNKEYIIFATPMKNTILNGKKIVALAASYDPTSFDQVLSMTSFNEQAYSQIITKNGTAVTRSSSPYAMKTGYNVFSTLENAELDNIGDISKIKQDIQSNYSDQISFTLDGEHRYMVYTPIAPEDWYLLTFVPVQVVNAKSDMLLRSTLLICGLIAFTFIGLIFALFLSFRNNKLKLEKLAYVDNVTGGNTIQRFYNLATNILDDSQTDQYALVYTNIEKFKVLNEQIGRENCDIILRHFNKYVSSALAKDECMGRLSADNFCILLHYTNEKNFLERLGNWYEEADKYVISGEMPWVLPVTGFGIFIIENKKLPFPLMIDRAKLALKESSHTFNNKIKYAFYDDEIRRQLVREKQIEDVMEQALNDREFKVYLQPKYIVDNETIGGAEALVRWESSKEGMIYPNEFIPLFEKNGFIIRLDLFIFEEVCRTIRSWIDIGLTPIKISVNCSRVHFKDSGFLAEYCRVANKYNVPKEYLEIELTESIVLENAEKLTEIIEEIHNVGFSCSMDDFGSGYSSLNLIQSIPVDTLKIDKIFFQNSINDVARTEAVVGSIVKMAKALSMDTVAEGVEYQYQVEMLKRVGCDYIQGYVFAKPMKISSFEEIAFGKTLE